MLILRYLTGLPSQGPRARALPPRANAAPYSLPSPHQPGKLVELLVRLLSQSSRFLSQILRYTESDHPDTPALTRSLQIAEGTLGGVNEAVRTNENEEKLAMLTDSLEFAGVEGASPLLSARRLTLQANSPSPLAAT